ncbi:MAG TPA: DNA translocase FtsK, partial [Cytophagaceae bacterium]
MAENTYKKPKDNKEKPKKAKESNKESAKEQPHRKARLGFVKDKRLHLAFGFFLMVFSVCLFISFISYLLTGANDQSVVEDLFNENVVDSGREAENWLGLSGAVISYYFIFKWFGLASFLFIPIFFLVSLRILIATPLPFFNSVLKTVGFFMFWLSLALGYVVLKLEGESVLAFLSGGIGYEMAVVADSLIGWGTVLFLFFTLITFMIYFFNITSLKPNADAGGKVSSEEEANKSLIPSGSNDPDLNLFDSKLDSEPIEEEISDEEWLVKLSKKDIKPKAAEGRKELVLDMQDFMPPIEQDLPPLAIEESKLDIINPAEVPLADGTIENYDPTLDLGSYIYPPIELLNEGEISKVQVTKEELEANKDKIVETLSHYSIGIVSIKATIGPTVTLYEIVPDPGIRISKIKNLEDDIALSLSALGIRIIAPIPGKGTIGIEVPNKNREMVAIRTVLATEKFLKSDKELPIVFGKTISNEIFVLDLAKMPHLLMAGATGQGKSVGLNVLLTSLIYKKHPSQLKFVLVDPKKVELSLFNRIERHFLAKLPNTEEAIIT